MWKLVFFAAFVASASDNVLFHDCGSLGVVLSLRVGDCSYDVCTVVRGTNVSVALEFVNDRNYFKLTVFNGGKRTAKMAPFNFEVPVNTLESVLTLDGIEKNLEGVENDVCSSLSQGDCPLGGGEFATYSSTIPMLQTYKRGLYDVEWKFLNEHGGMTVCVQFTVDFEYLG